MRIGINFIFIFQLMLSMTALDKNGLTVVMSPRKANGCLTIVMTASNNSLNALDQFLFQVKRIFVFFNGICN